jgi:hypothetical protein
MLNKTCVALWLVLAIPFCNASSDEVDHSGEYSVICSNSDGESFTYAYYNDYQEAASVSDDLGNCYVQQ